jgi:hypothetical protein
MVFLMKKEIGELRKKLYLCNPKNEPSVATYCVYHTVGHLFANGGIVVAACAS